jgi:hypothetical protein
MSRKGNIERALELYAEARRLEALAQYHVARKRFEESLALHEDAEVRAAYLRLLSMIGPM